MSARWSGGDYRGSGNPDWAGTVLVRDRPGRRDFGEALTTLLSLVRSVQPGGTARRVRVTLSRGPAENARLTLEATVIERG